MFFLKGLANSFRDGQYKNKMFQKELFLLTLYFIITPFDAFEILFENIMENGALNAPFSIIFLKVFKTLFKFFFKFFQCCLKIENDMI